VSFTVDESVDKEVADRLRQDGHEVLCISEMQPGMSDDLVLSLARERGDVLVTADKDFGELVFRQKRAASGIVLVRLAGLSQAAKANLVADAIRRHGDELPRAFTVVTGSMVRIRRPD
jgi:predicted nuclease of predicted toxin-antitoxin system